MIIGYDFWLDGVYNDGDNSSVLTTDNDGVAFDNCNPINNVNSFTLANGSFDELHITKDSVVIDNNSEKPDKWNTNTVLWAKFEDNLVAGTLGVDGHPITKIEIKKRKKGEDLWQTYFIIDFDENTSLYTVIDKFLENEEEYEYCLCPVATVDGKDIYGNNTASQEVYVSYDHAQIFDNTDTYNLIYNLKLGSLTNQIGANSIPTLSSQYPYVIYGENDYVTGSLECLLVSEESATGNVNIRSEKILRDKISSFLKNKKCKIFKNADGEYMLIKIIGTPTLIPNNEILGAYQVSFEFVEVGNANKIEDLSKFNLEFNYSKINKDDESVQYTKTVG